MNNDSTRTKESILGRGSKDVKDVLRSYIWTITWNVKKPIRLMNSSNQKRRMGIKKISWREEGGKEWVKKQIMILHHLKHQFHHTPLFREFWVLETQKKSKCVALVRGINNSFP